MHTRQPPGRQKPNPLAPSLKGTVAKIFGGQDHELLPALIAQLLEGVMPYFAEARAEKVGRYLPPDAGKGKRKRVMK